MKKYLILMLSFSFLFLFSCKNERDTIVYADQIYCVEDLNTSSLELVVNIYSSPTIESLYIKNDSLIKKSTLLYKNLIKINNKDWVLYQYQINFSKEILFKKNLILTDGKKEYNLNIGSYRVIEVPASFSSITVSVKIKNNDFDIYIHNSMDRTIYLTKIENYLSDGLSLDLSMISVGDIYIYTDSIKKIVGSKINYENYKSISGIIKLTFMSNLKTYVVYAKYQQTKDLKTILEYF